MAYFITHQPARSVREKSRNMGSDTERRQTMAVIRL